MVGIGVGLVAVGIGVAGLIWPRYLWFAFARPGGKNKPTGQPITKQDREGLTSDDLFFARAAAVSTLFIGAMFVFVGLGSVVHGR